MAKLSKQQAKLHAQACTLLEKDELDFDDKCFVLDNWQESANHMNGVAGAFFTPRGLARDLAMEVSGRRVVDLCAGIGSLAFAFWNLAVKVDITCIEQNPDYLAVGKKILPEANWLLGDVFTVAPGMSFDCAFSNPPFGNVKTGGNYVGRYTGSKFEYKIIDLAQTIAQDGVFLVPQMALPFQYSGLDHYETRPNPDYDRFSSTTGITLSMNCGFDTEQYRSEWKLLSVPTLEIALGFTHDS